MTTRGAKHGKLLVIFLKLVSRVCAMWRKRAILCGSTVFFLEVEILDFGLETRVSACWFLQR